MVQGYVMLWAETITYSKMSICTTVQTSHDEAKHSGKTKRVTTVEFVTVVII